MFKEEPIPLITFDTQDIKINNEAIEIIKKIKQPISIISVVGLYRTGKSYLINRLILNKQKGFGVGNSINPCTKGLWMWGTPLQWTSQDGTLINIIVIDTEGIGSLDQDSNHDSKVFSLAIILSSLFIYNSIGSIDESAIQNISFIVQLTQQLQQDQISDDQLCSYFPQFLWVLRDFSLKLMDQDGESISACEYLEQSLQLNDGYTDDIEQKNRVRKLIKTFFKVRNCATLVRPTNKEQDLQNLHQSEIRQEFNDQIEFIRQNYVQNVQTKKLYDKEMDGEMLVSLIYNYINQLNKGLLPNIENQWQQIF